MASFITSERQMAIMRFLERTGPAPLAALQIRFGHKAKAALKRLRRADYVYNLTLSGIEFWSPQHYGRFDPRYQELLTWFVVRLENENGEYLGPGRCITPNGTRLAFKIQAGRPSKVLMMDDKNNRFMVALDDLKIHSLSTCLKWDKSGK